MNHLYHTLIDDTLTYLQELLHQNPSLPISLVKQPEVPQSPPPPPNREKAQNPPPPPAASITHKEEKKREDPFITLTPPTIPALKSTDTIKKLLSQIEPELHLHDTPLSDLRAKQVKEGWKRDAPTIPILFQGKPFRSFIINIARSIEITFNTSCRLVEVKKGQDWTLFLQSSNVQFIIAPDYLIFSTQELLPLYKETPQQRVRYLGTVPLLLLPNLSLYYKDPQLKRSLWHVITHHLRPLF